MADSARVCAPCAAWKHGELQLRGSLPCRRAGSCDTASVLMHRSAAATVINSAPRSGTRGLEKIRSPRSSKEGDLVVSRREAEGALREPTLGAIHIVAVVTGTMQE